MTTPHDKALEAAARAMAVQGYARLNRIDTSKEKIDGTDHFEMWFTVDKGPYLADAQAAISAYLSSIGGVVCAREPVGNIHINSLELLKEGSIAHIYPIATVNDRMRPIHIPMEAADATAPSPAEQFAKWLEDGPRLAKAAGCYVGIKVTNLPSPPSPSNEGEKQA